MIMIMTTSGIEPTTSKLVAHHLKCKAFPVNAVNITVHNSVPLNSNTANCAFIVHRVAYYVNTTKLSCDCY